MRRGQDLQRKKELNRLRRALVGIAGATPALRLRVFGLWAMLWHAEMFGVKIPRSLRRTGKGATAEWRKIDTDPYLAGRSL